MRSRSGASCPSSEAACLLGQELAVADERGHRRQQLLAHVGKPRPALAIGVTRARSRPSPGAALMSRPAPSRRSIFSSRRGELDRLGVVVVAARRQRLLPVARHRVRGQAR